MTLDVLLRGVDVVRGAEANPDICRVSRVAEGVDRATVFVAYRSPLVKHRHELHDAARVGAAVIMVDEHDERPCGSGSPTVVVRHVNQAYATICANLFGNAHRELRFYGVTGTKGKTTTCHLVESILRRAGVRTGLITSLVQRIGRREMVSDQTTPDAARLHKQLRKMCAAGVTHVVLEVSSIGLAEDRLHGIRFDGVVLTNLAPDHLDYHGGLAAYKAAKRRLFTESAFHTPDRSVSVLNLDDPFGVELAGEALGTVVTYGIENGDVRPQDVDVTGGRVRATIGGRSFESRLPGTHNLSNLLAALALTQAELGMSDALATGVRDVTGLPGRFEHVPPPAPGAVDVFVDYAHTPESVRAVLTAAEAIGRDRRRVVVVGCRGGSDKSKRVPMAQAALAHSDVCILTSNNPNREDPHRIIRDMTSGLPVTELVRAGKLALVADRREAIYRAVEAAAPNGIVMLLGRGSQTTHTIGVCEMPFDDREVARAALASLCRPAV
jgi:UDP-N-acetylmuramoyl-L-alanyl-D-glutamate--2,6-diaminopimelate ligase